MGGTGGGVEGAEEVSGGEAADDAQGNNFMRGAGERGGAVGEDGWGLNEGFGDDEDVGGRPARGGQMMRLQGDGPPGVTGAARGER